MEEVKAMRAARLDLYGEDPKQAAAEMKAHEEMVKQKIAKIAMLQDILTQHQP